MPNLLISRTSITLLFVHHPFKLLNLSGTIAIRHSGFVSFLRMSLIVFLLKDHRPVVKLGGGIFQNFRDWAVNLPGNSHRQSESKTAPD